MKPYPKTLAFARIVLDQAVRSNDPQAIAIQHTYLVHGDGSTCCDGCDAQPIPAYQKLFDKVCSENGL